VEAIPVDYDTTRLMKILGFPNSRPELADNVTEDDLLKLLPLAIENKVPLFFLERAVTLCKNSKSLETHYQIFLEKSQSFSSLMGEVSNILAKAQTDYVVFKTFRPFPFVTVDADILFFTREEFWRAHRELRRAYKLGGFGAYSITLYDQKRDINLDLHLDIAVSRMVYMNIQLLRKYMTKVSVNGSQLSVLTPPAAIVTVLSHSLYKEQMLTLSDYYTTLTQILKMTSNERRALVDLAEQLNLGLSLKLALNLIDSLTKMVFRRSPSVIADIADMIQIDEIEEKAMHMSINKFVQPVQLPYKYPLLSVSFAFMMKSIKDPLMRSTAANQFFEIFTNTSKFIEAALPHIRGTV
jgi:hypothetical protein